MTLEPSRTECLLDGRWYLSQGGPPAGHWSLRLPSPEVPALPGETRRIEDRGTAWAYVRKDAVERRVRHNVSTVFEGVPALVATVLDGRVELYSDASEAGCKNWPGDRHDGWALWVPVDDIGEVKDELTELSADGGSGRG